MRNVCKMLWPAMLGLVLAETAMPAQSEPHFGRGEVLDDRYHHGHFYPRRSKTFSKCIAMFTCTSLRPTHPGSTRSSCGSPRSSVTSSPAAYSLPSPI